MQKPYVPHSNHTVNVHWKNALLFCAQVSTWLFFWVATAAYQEEQAQRIKTRAGETPDEQTECQSLGETSLGQLREWVAANNPQPWGLEFRDKVTGYSDMRILLMW